MHREARQLGMMSRRAGFSDDEIKSFSDLKCNKQVD
jgi:hypothetical protein